MTEQLNFHRTGSGSPMLLIHGIGGSWEHWKPLIGGLAPEHDLILPDLPGFGRLDAGSLFSPMHDFADMAAPLEAARAAIAELFSAPAKPEAAGDRRALLSGRFGANPAAR